MKKRTGKATGEAEEGWDVHLTGIAVGGVPGVLEIAAGGNSGGDGCEGVDGGEQVDIVILARLARIFALHPHDEQANLYKSFGQSDIVEFLRMFRLAL